ncbi:uncharacterized protein N7482_009045 [Penicillium canariense]|uniref:Cobalamin-independent methionine synthase MetE C-terminal/archaeal domain-containing protein n=1 Tax=Penicillium canariense TaxID=189055 RepID=A0A9W9HNA8_9EURO|nr:uncharacterized protein N7482_009045 [Penicillium canariense]KAJ5152567.1 hypothetical protein N7482_009045 [Penicillium canariense]
MAHPFRAEHIGSLLRPAELLAARSAAGVTSSYSQMTEDIHKATDQAIAGVVAKQLELGVRPITSGEYERDKFYSGFFEKLKGMEVIKDIPISKGYRTNFPTLRTLKALGIMTRDSVVAVDRISRSDSPYLSEWKALRSRLPRELWKDCKLTMPPITHSHMQMATGTAYRPNIYSSDQEYFKDLADAYVAEFRALYDEGLRSIQIDDPCLLFFVTDEFRSGCVADGIDPDELLDEYIWAHNQCLFGKPADLHVGLHLCRGNMAGSTHIMSGSYERIAKKIFSELAYDTYYLEAGDFQPLRHLPIGKNVILGVISTKSPDLESLDELVARVHSAAQVIALGQERSVAEVIESSLGVSPQCGFASMSSGGANGMTMDIMWAKLLLVQRLAKRIWG